jgi:tripartite-type tricarboxylate transporter receptor subunit TctC
MKAKTLLLAALLLAAAWGAQAQEAYPSKPVRLVVNFAPGGTVDIIGRVLAQNLAAALGQPVVVENRPGAGGNIGAEAVAKSAPDGYTLLMSSGPTLTTNAHLYRSIGFDLKDFAPITEVARIASLLIVKPGMPVSSAAEFLAFLKANPGKLTYGSAGNGTGPHIAGEMLGRMTGIPVIHVPYKGLGPALTDLLAGQIDFLFDGGGAMSHIRSGKVKLLAVGSAERLSLFPDSPTLIEAGLPTFHYDSAHALAAPAATPREIVTRLNREAVRILKSPEVVERIHRAGAEPIGNSPEEAAANMRAEHARIGRFIREAGIRAD